MDESLTLKVTQMQLFLSVLIQIWIIVAPIIIIRKLNYLIALFQNQPDGSSESS